MGGLYDLMASDARQEAQANLLAEQRRQNQAALNQITANYENQMKAVQEQMAMQQESYSANLGEMQNTLKTTQDSLLASQDQLLSSQKSLETSNERQAAMQEAQQKMQLKMNAQMNPNTRQKNMGVKGAAKSGVQQQALKRQGIAGQFGREGLRIKNINI